MGRNNSKVTFSSLYGKQFAIWIGIKKRNNGEIYWYVSWLNIHVKGQKITIFTYNLSKSTATNFSCFQNVSHGRIMYEKQQVTEESYPFFLKYKINVIDMIDVMKNLEKKCSKSRHSYFMLLMYLKPRDAHEHLPIYSKYSVSFYKYIIIRHV